MSLVFFFMFLILIIDRFFDDLKKRNVAKAEALKAIKNFFMKGGKTYTVTLECSDVHHVIDLIMKHLMS